MNKRGVSTVEILMWLVGSAFAVFGYVHMFFATYREVVPRLDRIEQMQYQIMEKVNGR